MTDVQNYRDLKVWQKAIDAIPEIYACLKAFPKTEDYALAGQIRRAAVSVPANIAEGNARQHRKEYLQSLFISRGSLAELDTLLIVAERLNYLSPSERTSLEARLLEIARMLQALINALQ